MKEALRALAVLALAWSPAKAQAPDPGLYRADTIVTGTDMRSRPAGFAECLRQVLVKVSGEPKLRDDPRVAALAAHADQFVTRFTYVDPRAAIRPHDDQGTYDRSQNLTVWFDPSRIDTTLTELGDPPWRGPRPVIVPVLVVRGMGVPHTATYLLSAEAQGEAQMQRQSFANSAATYGMAVRIPTDAELAAWGIKTAGFPAPPAQKDAAVVAGTLEFRPAALGWVGSWRLRWHDQTYRWGDSGVGFDEAFDDLVRGAMRIVSGHGGPQ